MKNIEEFAEQLRISVDSRIKLIEYNMGKVIMPYIPTNEICDRNNFDRKNVLPTFASEKLYNDKLFKIIEDYSANICKLMYIRSKIDTRNAVQVSRLIESKEYINWDKKRLRAFFGDQPSSQSSTSSFD